jgi:hypothetical protein
MKKIILIIYLLLSSVLAEETLKIGVGSVSIKYDNGSEVHFKLEDVLSLEKNYNLLTKESYEYIIFLKHGRGSLHFLKKGTNFNKLKKRLFI